MKTTLKFITLAGLLFLFVSCRDSAVEPADDIAPTAPTGLHAKTGDGKVDLFWNFNRERDVRDYEVLWAFSYDGDYESLGFTENNYFTDNTAENGETYYYAIVAHDWSGNASNYSVAEVHASPRPEGFNYAIFDFRQFPDLAGFSFVDYDIHPYDSLQTDFFFDIENGVPYIDVHADTDIADMGATNSLNDIKMAPSSGYKPLLEDDDFKYVEAKVGHTYVIRTWDVYYAKIRVREITGERIFFDWAFQISQGKPNLEKRGTRRKLKTNLSVFSRTK